MAVIKSRQQERQFGIKSILPMLMGIIIGAMGMHLLQFGEDAPTGSSRLPTGILSSSSSQSQAESPPGWHPIHVFYGDRKGLGAPETQRWFSQVHQDEIVVDLVGKNGYFVDLAANDAKDLTNTLALERDHGWNGLCIEPNPGYWYGLSHRKCTVIAALVGGTTSEKVQVKFRGVYGGIVGKFPAKMADRKNEPDAPTEDRYTAPIRSVLQQFHVPKVIDYMSLDVEGSEFDVMKDFPFEEYTIRLMTIERPSKELKNLLQSKGYSQLKKLAWWGETLWAHESMGLSPDHPKIAKIKTEERN